VEVLCVRACPIARGPSCGSGSGGGGSHLIPQLGAELAAEQGRSASSVENGPLLVVSVLGSGVRRSLLCVIREPLEGLRGGFVTRQAGARHLDDSSPGVGGGRPLLCVGRAPTPTPYKRKQ
jgi:hypothetical protein